MGCSQARRLCPDAIVVPPRMSAYSDASRAVFAVFDDTTPLVEGLSIDEAFLDVRGLERIAGTPRQIAARLRRRVLEQVGLPITVGVARTKFLAKVASGVAKPDGLLIVPPGAELGFLHPLPVERLWGVGPVTAEKLRRRGIITVGEVARLERARARRDARPRVRPPAARAGAQPRPAPGAPPGAGGVRWARSARWAARRHLPRRPGCSARRAGRPADPAAARRAAAVPHGHDPAALRRLLARDALAHAVAVDLPDADDPRDRAWPARRRRCR